jgi:hypothetical protein
MVFCQTRVFNGVHFSLGASGGIMGQIWDQDEEVGLLKRQRAEMKAELMAEAEGVVDELLQWDESTSAPTLAEIETVVLKLRQRLSARMAEVVVNGQEAAQPGRGPRCPCCQREMHRKGVKATWVETRAGRVSGQAGVLLLRAVRGRWFFPSGSAIAVGGLELE